jgi:hypothetical protein
MGASQSTKGMTMILNGEDLSYLAKVLELLKADKLPQATMTCPECGETLPDRSEAWDSSHTFLSTWESYESTNVRDTIAIGCEGYHILRDYI